MSPRVRQATIDDHVDIMRLFDGALLETDADRIRSQLDGDCGTMLLAVDSRPVGAIALSTEVIDDRPAEWPTAVQITAIAVSKQRRGRGVGRRLIAAAAEWAAPRALSATFDERVEPFYIACGFEIERHAGRLWAIRPAAVD